jgi:alpha,alpha-trehalose phosphorylase
LLQVRVSAGKTEYKLLHGDVLAFTHRGVRVEVTASSPVKELP